MTDMETNELDNKIIIYQSDDGRGENREPGARTGIAPGHIFVIAKVAPGEKGAAIGTKLKSHIERSKYIETVLNYKINLKKRRILSNLGE